jgi:Surfeit locus protein 6
MTRSSVEGHDLFFSRIISMISTDMYNHTAAREVVDSNAKYYKHKKVALAADERKLASNKKKLLKYAVDNSETEPMEYAETNNDDDYHQDTSVSEGKDNFGESDGAYQDVVKPSLEELRLRLQSRILGLKSMRTSTKERDPNFAGEKSQTSRKKARNDHVKRKPSKPSDAADSEMDVQDNDNSFEAANESNGSSHHHVESTSIDDFGDVQFSLISAKKAADESKISSLSKPGTKMKRLKRMLETADKKRQRLDELKSAGSAGANRLKQEQWTDALKSATGEKTLNDSTKLRKAIKKREKKKETSAREWKVSYAAPCFYNHHVDDCDCLIMSGELYYVISYDIICHIT